LSAQKADAYGGQQPKFQFEVYLRMVGDPH
jgi:hypothetical protein